MSANPTSARPASENELQGGDRLTGPPSGPPPSAQKQEGGRLPTLFAYPLKGIAYCDELYRTLARQGIHAVEGHWSGRWMMENIHRGDILHIHWPSFLYYHPQSQLQTLMGLARFFLLLSLMRRRGVRIVWTAHNLYPHAGGRSLWSHRLARRFITRMACRVLVHSDAAAALVTQEFGVTPDKLRRIPHGHWKHLYRPGPPPPEARRIIGIPRDAFVYGFVGSCRPYKNLEALIQTFQRMEGKSHLLIAGSFASLAYRQELGALVAPTVANRVHFVDRFLADEEIMMYVNASDALVLPYKEILTSGGAMLGLSAGVPVVAPRLGGIPEVVTDRCGVLYDPAATEGLFAAMREVQQRSFVIDDIVRHALSFDWNDAVQPLTELVRQVLS